LPDQGGGKVDCRTVEYEARSRRIASNRVRGGNRAANKEEKGGAEKAGAVAGQQKNWWDEHTNRIGSSGQQRGRFETSKERFKQKNEG